MGVRHEMDRWPELAKDVEKWGVEQACEIHGIHRSTWYRRLKTRPEQTSADSPRDELVRTVLQLATERPAWGCDKIAYYLGVSGTRTSSPTVQKILVEHGLGKRAQREAKAREKEERGESS